MSAQTLFFTNMPVGGLATLIGGIGGSDDHDYVYKDMSFFRLNNDAPEIIPGLVQYGIWPGFNLQIFDLAKEYLSKVGDVFILVKICQGYPTPPHTLMPEITVDLRGSIPGEWPPFFLDTLPDKKVWKDYRLESSADDFTGYSPSKENPFLEWFIKYRLIIGSDEVI